jgi:hypothetical protein
MKPRWLHLVAEGRSMNATRVLCSGAIWLLLATCIRAQDAPGTEQPSEPEAPPVASDQLSVEQGRLADRFKRLEEVLGRLAEFSASSDPRRAKLLREAISQSREQDINVRFESIVNLLEDERLSAASTNQTELEQELDALLNLLLKADRDKELASERDRVKKYLKEVARLIRMQKGVRARTEGGDELDRLRDDQERVAGDTGKLGDDISKTEGDQPTNASKGAEKKPGSSDTKGDSEKADSAKPGESSKSNKSSESDEPSKSPPADGKPTEPSDSPPSDSGKPSQSQPGQPSQGQPGQPSPGSESEEQPPQPPRDPADRAAQRLRAAQQQMEQAQKDLEEAERKGAAGKQREALRALEQAKAELERILRQLREEELERTLTQLAARFRKMLESQVQVYEGTVRLAQVPQAKRDHDDEIEAARLSRQELQIVQDADKALLLLREEGSSVAFPEIIEQTRDDMRKVALLLAALRVDTITQGLELDIIATLEETIAALEKAIKDLEKQRTPPGQTPAAGQPAEPPLVDKLAELKMIRALQMRIYKRTQSYGRMIEGEQAETPELLEALEDLAKRQERVFQATADLAQGKND